MEHIRRRYKRSVFKLADELNLSELTFALRRQLQQVMPEFFFFLFFSCEGFVKFMERARVHPL